MNNEYDFFLPRKDCGRILRRERLWYLLAMVLIELALIADVIGLILSFYRKPNWWLIALFPILVTLFSVVYFFANTNGGVKIYNKCHVVFKPDRVIELSCEREYGFHFQGEARFGKTMRVSKIRERYGYWVVYGKKRQWAVLPKAIPVEELLGLKAVRSRHSKP